MTKKMINTTKENAPRCFAINVKGNKELCGLIQKYLFEHLDAYWQDNNRRISTDDFVEVLLVRNGLHGFRIAYCDEYYYQNSLSDTIPLVTVVYEMKLVVESLRQEAEVIDVEGKQYHKEELLNAIKDLKVVA